MNKKNKLTQEDKYLMASVHANSGILSSKKEWKVLNNGKDEKNED